MTCSHTNLPDGMALIEVDDGRWFPAFAPVGVTQWVRIVDDLTAGIIPPAVDLPANPCQGYESREAALEACCAWHEAAAAPVQWAQLAAQAEVYPERNAWYLEEIAHLTGEGVPLFSSGYDVLAAVLAEQGECSTIITVTCATPDEAIEALYQRVYAWSCEPHVMQRAS